MKTTRAYSMTARAEATEETRRSILASVVALSAEKTTLEIVLADVADRAGVTTKTILRHFGSRDGLFDAATEFARNEVVHERLAPVGDLAAAIAVVVDHYEERGDWVMRMLAQEHSDERVGSVVDMGRGVHRDWVATTFRPQLDRLSAAESESATDLLAVATDVYVWKLLRRDRGLSRDETEQRMRVLAQAIVDTVSTSEGDELR